MLKSKHEPGSIAPTKNTPDKGTEHGINSLNEDAAQEMSSHLPLKAIAKLAYTSKSNYQLFKPILEEAKKVLSLLTVVVQGNPDELAELVKANPALLFRKGQVTDPAGQTFYDVSAYQLMTFLCDDDMKANIMPLIPEGMQEIRRRQYAELGRGGADLIKMDRDPTSLPFEEVTLFIDRDPDGDSRYPLLENPDGIVYYNADTSTKHIYYVNQETKTVELIKPTAHSQKEHQALERLYASFANMEMNSSRRSSNDEHQLIASTMQHALHRKGIEYERVGIRYCDSRIDFRLINAYRKCIRLYDESCWDQGDISWRREVGQEQRRVMWLLQRLCEKDRPFFPLPDFKASAFKRGFEIYNYLTLRIESVYVGGRLVDGFGSHFAVYKAWWGVRGGVFTVGGGRAAGCRRDVVAVCRLVEDAKANVVESMPEANQSSHHASADFQRWPG